MKRFFCIAVALAIILSQFTVVSSAALDETNYKTVDKFIGEFVELTENALPSLRGEADLLYGENGENATSQKEQTKQTEYTNRLIVKSEKIIDPLDSVGYVNGYDDLHILQFSDREAFQKAYDYYASLDYVQYVEEDMYLHEAVSDEGVVYESAVDYPTSVQSNVFGYTVAKRDSDGYNVDIAVIDSGIEINHDFLKGRVVDSGFDSINNSGSANDDRGHGTHVAGIIVANTLDNVTVHAYKGLNSLGSGTAVQISLAIDAALEDGMDIINLSMSMKGTSETLYNAVKKAYDAGVCVVVAAGNAGVDLAANPYSPGGFEEAISVMSCTTDKELAETSNYGTPCDFAAPGEQILSSYLNNTYKISSGTSMAAPFICAAVSYLLAKDNTLTPDEICTKLDEQAIWMYGAYRAKYVQPGTAVQISSTTPAPVFSLADCTFIGTMKIELSCQFADADIFYSTENSIVVHEYKEPFYISETTTIKAFALVNGYRISEVATATYTRVSGDVSDFQVDENGMLILYNGELSNVVVPSCVDGRTILSVAETAFSGQAQLQSITFENSVNEIKANTFKGCSNLVLINAPAVTYIGEGAFEGCINLVRFVGREVVEVSQNAFKDCTKLSEFSAVKVEKIGQEAFKNTTSFTNLSSPVIVEIGDSAFENSGLAVATISTANKIGNSAFSNCTSLQSVLLTSATEIGTRAFENCSSLTTVSLGNGVITVPVCCFNGCTALSELDAPKVETVEAYAFQDCSALKAFSFPVIITAKEYSFKGTGLTSINSETLSSIDKTTFLECRNLTSIIFNSLQTVDLSAFESCNFARYFTFGSATTIIFPAGGAVTYFPYLTRFSAPSLTQLPNNAFLNCKQFNNYDFSALQTIGEYAFMNTAIGTIDFPLAISVGKGAFVGADKVTSISLPKVLSLSADNFSLNSKVTTININRVTTLPSDIVFSEYFPEVEEVSAVYVKEIPDYYFKDCRNLNNISFSTSGLTIGKGAFENCNFTDMYIKATAVGEGAFSGNQLTSLQVDTVKTLDCDILGTAKSTLTSLVLLSVTDVNDITFNDIPNLTTVRLDNLLVVPNDCFKGLTKLDTIVLSKAEEIGDGAFYGCSSLKSISLDKATNLGNEALRECTSLETLYLGYVTELGDNALYGCSGLVRLSAPKLEEIDFDFVLGCDNLEIIYLDSVKELPCDGTDSPFVKLKNLKEFSADSVTSVPDFAFMNCTSLELIDFDNAEYIGYYAFKNCPLTRTGGTFVPKAKTIADYAFMGTGVENLDLNATTIGKGVFKDCKNLKWVEMPKLKVISDNTFDNCTSLNRVDLGEIEEIGAYAFNNCAKLLWVEYTGAPSIGKRAFYGCSLIYNLERLNPSAIGSQAFYGTDIVYDKLELPNVVRIDDGAFDGVEIKNLILENVEVIYDVPENANILIGSKVTEGAIDKNTTSTIYSPAGSVVSKYCIANGVRYKEFNETNPIISNTPKLVKDYGETMLFDALGFNVEYSWYGCNKEDCSDAVLLKTDRDYYVPITTVGKETQYKYFYCVAKSTENGNVVNIKSRMVENAFTFVASQSIDVSVDYEAGYVYSYNANGADMISGTYIDDDYCKIIPKNKYSSADFCGTGSKISVAEDGNVFKEYAFILEGDVNGDGVVDALDCYEIGLVANEKGVFEDEASHRAAGLLYDDFEYITSNNYQAAVNKALSN